MKPTTLSTLFLLTLFFSCTYDKLAPGVNIKLENKQNVLLSHLTATWCQPSHNTGYPNLEEIENAQLSGLIPLCLHMGNSTMIPKELVDSLWGVSELNGFLIENLPSGAFPTYSLNNLYLPYSTTPATVITTAEEMLQSQPSALIGLRVLGDGQNITSHVKCQFLNDSDSAYHLSLLVVENEAQGRQVVNGIYIEDYTHTHILRTSALGTDRSNQLNAVPINQGPVRAGQEIEYSNTFFITQYTEADRHKLPHEYRFWEYDANNTTIIAILWKENEFNYEVVNCASARIE